MSRHRRRSRDHDRRSWWKSFRTTAAIGYAIRHFSESRNRLVIERAEIREGERVVDIGCGPGESAVLAARSAPRVRVIAADPAWPCCLVTRIRAWAAGARVRVCRSPAEALRVPSGWATLVVSINAFHHWADPERGLSEVRRVLRPGGRLILVDEDFPEDHRHTRFHREAGRSGGLHAGSPEARRWLAALGFGGVTLDRMEDAGGRRYHLLRAVLGS